MWWFKKAMPLPVAALEIYRVVAPLMARLRNRLAPFGLHRGDGFELEAVAFVHAAAVSGIEGASIRVPLFVWSLSHFAACPTSSPRWDRKNHSKSNLSHLSHLDHQLLSFLYEAYLSRPASFFLMRRREKGGTSGTGGTRLVLKGKSGVPL